MESGGRQVSLLEQIKQEMSVRERALKEKDFITECPFPVSPIMGE